MTRHDLFQLRLCAHAALLRPERSRSSGSAPDRGLVKWFIDHAARLGCGPLPALDLGDLEIGIGAVEHRTWIALRPVGATAFGARAAPELAVPDARPVPPRRRDPEANRPIRALSSLSVPRGAGR